MKTGPFVPTTLPLAVTLCAAALTLSACGAGSRAAGGTSGSAPSSASGSASGSAPVSAPAASTVGSVVAVPGYQVSVFAKAPAGASAPDSIDVEGSTVYVGFQNVTAKDGSDNKTSTIVAFDGAGTVTASYRIPGHNDGLRLDRATHQLWAMANEDGHPELSVIDLASGAQRHYTFGTTPHGGGYDDIVFLGGTAYLSASNPTLTNNTNTFPAVVAVTLSGTRATTRPVLMGNAKAKDYNSGAAVTVNAIDPDSMFVNPDGDLTVDNQAGTALISIHHPGPAQTVRQLTVGTQVDDTVYPAAGTGRLLVADTKANTVYAIRGALDPKVPMVATPDDSGVNGFVGKLDPSSGNITPVVAGLVSPHGMAYVAG